MSLESIDMQMSVSRTTKTGTIQDQLMRKPTEDQTLLAAQMQRQKDEERKRSEKIEQHVELTVKEDGAGSNRQQREDRSKSNESNQEGGKAEHPYKGHHIDIMG